MQVPDIVVQNTLVDYPRLELIEFYVHETRFLTGDIAEVGVYKGGTAHWICKHAHPNKRIFLLDTFNGMPPVSKEDIHKEGDFNDTSIQHVTKVLAPFANYSIYQGIFPKDNTQYLLPHKFSFVHLDVDIYTSVYDCLNFFLPLMVPKSVILLDDYNEPNCPGAKSAADLFCLQNNLKVIPTVQSQALIQL